jgi:hypothetical protein
VPVRVGPLHIGIRIPRIERDNLAVVGNGAIEVSPVGPGQPPVVIGSGKFRIDADRLGVICNCPIKVTLLDPNETAAIVKVSKLRIDRDCVIAILQSAVERLVEIQCPTSVGITVDVPGLEPDHLAEIRNCSVVVALVQPGPGTVTIGIGEL